MQWRQLVWSVLLWLPVAGCASMNDDRPDHTVEASNVGKEKIVDFTYAYGNERPQHLRILGLGGDGRTQRMPVPEAVTLTWTTASDGKKHEATVQIRSKAPTIMEGKIVSFEIDGSVLRVYIDKRLPDFRRERTQIYGAPK
jgi:hypothetical protein